MACTQGPLAVFLIYPGYGEHWKASRSRSDRQNKSPGENSVSLLWKGLIKTHTPNQEKMFQQILKSCWQVLVRIHPTHVDGISIHTNGLLYPTVRLKKRLHDISSYQLMRQKSSKIYFDNIPGITVIVRWLRVSVLTGVNKAGRNVNRLDYKQREYLAFHFDESFDNLGGPR